MGLSILSLHYILLVIVTVASLAESLLGLYMDGQALFLFCSVRSIVDRHIKTSSQLFCPIELFIFLIPKACMSVDFLHKLRHPITQEIAQKVPDTLSYFRGRVWE